MQERRLRLGEVLDDYCPREKRLTNHVIVALVGDEVRTTRCSTCDTEHVYKDGKLPTRRKKPVEPQAALYKTVLENITGRDADTDAPLGSVPAEVEAAPAAPLPVAPGPVSPVSVSPVSVAPLSVVPPSVATTPVVTRAALPTAGVAPAATRPREPLAAALPDAAATDGPPHEEPVHRHQLIRASLPKVDGHVPERKPADFTLYAVARAPQGRRGRPRPPQGAGNANWGGYSPYANGHPSGKGSQQPGPGGHASHNKGRPNPRRGR